MGNCCSSIFYELNYFPSDVGTGLVGVGRGVVGCVSGVGLGPIGTVGVVGVGAGTSVGLSGVVFGEVDSGTSGISGFSGTIGD